MKNILKYIFVFVVISASFTSCFKENMDTFGKYYVYMSKDTTFMTLKDTLLKQGIDTLDKDSSVKVLGITRSGIAPQYPAITVRIKVDSAYLDSMSAICNNASIPTASKSSSVLYFKNTIILPADCYELNRSVVIPENGMVGEIGLRLHLKKIAKLTPSKSLILPILIQSASSDTIKQTKKRTLLRFNRKFVYKTVTL